MSETEKKEEAKEVHVQGFTLLLSDGVMKLTPINVSNDLELIGFLDYANQKKQELLQKLCNSPENRTLDAVSQLTGLLGQVFTLAKEQIKEGKVPG